MTAQDILETLNLCYLTHPKYLINNLYVFGWESDYLACTRSGYWYEVEVKVSRADFLADFKKKKKHAILSGAVPGLRPNYFAYAVPAGLIQPEDVPEYAGLIYVPENGYYYSSGGKATPQLHKRKIPDEELRLTEKFYYNYKSLLPLRTEQQKVANDLRRQISLLKKEYKVATGHDFNEIF